VVDSTGVGGGVYDVLREQLGDELVFGVDFGGRALNRDRYANRRAEMWDHLRQAFTEEAALSIPDNEDLQSDLCAPAWGKADQRSGQQLMTRYRLDGTLVLEDKDHIRRRLKFSPDWGDAAAMTFAVSFDEFLLTMPAAEAVMGPGAWML